ncbi:hypothetical protein BITS_0913, partial [Bifidobacterium tsurumiense]
MMDRIVRETYLEFTVENFQLGADLIHCTFIHLHEIHEFGDLLGGELSVLGTSGSQPCLHLIGIDVLMSIKYHEDHHNAQGLIEAGNRSATAKNAIDGITKTSHRWVIGQNVCLKSPLMPCAARSERCLNVAVGTFEVGQNVCPERDVARCGARPGSRLNVVVVNGMRTHLPECHGTMKKNGKTS